MSKHIEQHQLAHSTAKVNDASTSRRSGLKVLLASLAFVIGIGYGMTFLWNPAPTDNLSNAQKSELLTEYSKIQSVRLEPVAADDMTTALDSMRLAPDQRNALKAALGGAPSTANSPTQLTQTALVWVNLWDFAAPDGDVVHISSAGYEVDVTLLKVQTRMAVPVGASQTIAISGVFDGGGGITLGIQADKTAISLPVLSVGQTLTLPVIY